MPRRISTPRGFTLLEVLISSALAGVVMIAVLSSFLFIGRNLSRLASHQALESESRKALAYIRKDFTLAQAVKSGTTPTSSTVTLVVPSGEITYTYDSVARRVRRQANFGATQDSYLLQNTQCECTSFTFSYYTTGDAAPTDQVTPTTYVPYSIKQIQVAFVVESPSTWTSDRRTRLESISSRFLIRNRTAPNGT
jgi:prepilin-type N-terminal cleavage/methylation domain-containing protein